MKKDYSEYQPSETEKYHYWHGNSREARFDYFDNRVSFLPESKSIRIQVDPYNEEIMRRKDIEEDDALQEKHLGIKLKQEGDPDDEEYREKELKENQEDYDRLSSRYQIDREQYEEQLGYWYDYHHEEKMVPQNNVLSGTVIRLQYGEGLLDFIYADFLPEYKKAMENILLLKSFAEIVAEEYFPDRKSPEEQREPEADKVFNCTQEIVADYFKYASTCFYTRSMSYCSVYSAICPPVFDHDAVADKGLRRYYRYLTMLQKEYLELLEFCFDETYFPEVLGELHPAERYCLYRRLHDQPQVSLRQELFTFSARLMSGHKMPYGMDKEGLLSRLGKARTVTEQQKAFAEKHGVDPEDLINMSTIPHFLHVEYAFHSVADILELEFTKLLEHQVRFRKCGRCGRYFIMKGNYDTRYCDRVAEGTNRICQDLAAQENYQKKHEDNHAIHIYSKYYKRYSSRVRVKQIREDDFKQWKYQAITKRDECSEGKITVEEYIDWMESSFPNRPRKKG